MIISFPKSYDALDVVVEKTPPEAFGPCVAF